MGGGGGGGDRVSFATNFQGGAVIVVHISDPIANTCLIIAARYDRPAPRSSPANSVTGMIRVTRAVNLANKTLSSISHTLARCDEERGNVLQSEQKRSKAEGGHEREK